MRALAFGLLVVPFSCQERAVQPVDGPGTVSVDWVQSRTGNFVVRPEVAWCPGDSMLEILGIRGDTAFGLTLFAQDSIRPGQFPLVSGAVSSNWRPLAFGALRLASDSVNVGFEATAGNVQITRADSGLVSGAIDARFKKVDGPDTLRITGKFVDLMIRPAEGQCGRVFKPKP
jgi:hypothetical protein